MMKHSYLCIGGPLDGRNYPQPDGKTKFEVRELVSTGEIVNKDAEVNGVVPISRGHHYRREAFRSDPEDGFYVWVHEDLTPLGVIERILSSYHPDYATVLRQAQLRNGEQA